MKKLFLYCIFFSCLSLSAFVAQQKNTTFVHNDTLNLVYDSLPNTSIQWQFSTDSSNWTSIQGANTFRFRVRLNTLNLNQYYRAEITESSCTPYFSDILQLERDVPTYYWSDPAAWNSGIKPQANENVTIPAGRRIILDENPPQLSGLTVNGVLEFLEKDLELFSDYIMVMGTLQIGTENEPFTHQARITLTGTNTAQDIMGMGTRGIMVMGGNLELHGSAPKVIWTKINQHVPANTNRLSFQNLVDWKINDELVVAPTDYYRAANGNSITQKVSVQSLTANEVQLNQNLNAFRWGLLQYATPTGLSLTPTNLITPPQADSADFKTPVVLDERAAVGNLTRNIIIEAPNDNLWSTNGFGAHIMIMGQNSVAHVEGIEIKRGGQRGRLGRYPIHWHMLSYGGTQTYEDATGHYFRNSSVNESRNRGIVIHGTNGLNVSKNIFYNIEGHGVFTEDAVERRNVIDSNLVLMVRNPQLPANLALKQHEVGESGSSGFWISNPDNILTNNHAADCGTFGFWLAFPASPWGESASVLDTDGLLMNPSRILFGKFDNNTAHSNSAQGIMLDNAEIDNEGNTSPRQYASTTAGREPVWPWPTLRRFYLSNYSVWKNGSNGFWDRARRPYNVGAISADNCGRFFAGSGDDGIIERSLVIGTSLNHLMNGTDRAPQADFASGHSSSTPVAFATYHSSFDIRYNIVINFQAVENQRSGMYSTDDYYIRPVDKGQIRNTNNLAINAHPGVKLMAPYNYFTLASALWDPYGTWGPAGNFLVYNNPFLTINKTITEIAPSTAISGGVSVSGPFYGFEGFVLHGVGDNAPQNQPWMDLMGIHVRRLDANMNEIATWNLPSAQRDWLLQHMRHFATTPDSYYELTFPEETTQPTNFQMTVENMLDSTDTQVMAIQYSGTLNPTVMMQSPGRYSLYQQVNSIQEVINSRGETWYQDKATNRVWVKMRGGVWRYWTTNTNEAVPTSDDLLYEGTVLRIYQP